MDDQIPYERGKVLDAIGHQPATVAPKISEQTGMDVQRVRQLIDVLIGDGALNHTRTHDSDDPIVILNDVGRAELAKLRLSEPPNPSQKAITLVQKRLEPEQLKLQQQLAEEIRKAMMKAAKAGRSGGILVREIIELYKADLERQGEITWEVIKRFVFEGNCPFSIDLESELKTAIRRFIWNASIQIRSVQQRILKNRENSAVETASKQALDQTRERILAKLDAEIEHSVNNMHVENERRRPAMKTQSNPDPKMVFVAIGRDTKMTNEVMNFLRSLGLSPKVYEDGIKLTGSAAPSVQAPFEALFEKAQAVVILMTPDEEVRLKESLRRPGDSEAFEYQPRANVIFEAGLALATHPDRTVIVEVGNLRHISNLSGRHAVRLANTPECRHQFATKLHNAKCPIDFSDHNYLTTGDFTYKPDPPLKAAPNSTIPVPEITGYQLTILLTFASRRGQELSNVIEETKLSALKCESGLNKLTSLGYVYGDVMNDGETVFFLTEKGVDFLAEYEDQEAVNG